MKKELDEEAIEEDDEEDEAEEELEEDGDEETEIKELPISKKPISDIDFNNLDFSQFTPSVREINSTSPSLENIESRMDRPMFIPTGSRSGVSAGSSSSGSGRDDTYLPNQPGDNGPKYLESGGEIKTNVQRVDMQNIGRDVGALNGQKPENFFVSSESNFQSRNVEQVGMQPERVDMQNIGRKNPLEREEIKYEDQKKYEIEPK